MQFLSIPSFLPTRPAVATCFAALTLAAASLVQAQVYTEVGDAGQTPGTAQASGINVTNTGGQSTIFGSILGTNDADVFRINITVPGFFSASTVNLLTNTSGGPGGLDTQLFLFDSLFRPVMANDDANGTTLQSTLPSNSIFVSSLTPGIYYLGISLSGNDPVNLNNQLVFAAGGDPTAVRGPAFGINPAGWNDFDSQASFAQQGLYQINIFNTPDTGSTILLMLGAFGAIVFVRKVSAVRSVARS